MNKFDITKHIGFNMGYHDGVETLYPHFYNEGIIATDVPVNTEGTHKHKLDITLLFKGTRKEITNELVDKLLVLNDSSDNPSRPFRWYKYVMGCAMTDEPKSVEDTRNKSLDHVLTEIGNPEVFYIYEVIIK